jgi:hypothetical protein
MSRANAARLLLLCAQKKTGPGDKPEPVFL